MFENKEENQLINMEEIESTEDILLESLKQNKISLLTYNRVKVAKEYIEKKYSNKKNKDRENKKEWEVINEKMENMDLNTPQKAKIKEEVLRKEAQKIRLKRQKINVFDYKPLSVIGKGAFGEVRVCEHIMTKEVVAIKKLRKEEMHRKNQIIHVRNEKEILTKANEDWIVGLKSSFQDEKFLYIVMEYCPGGDLMSQLMKKDVFTEDEGRFYMAELVLAVEAVHKLNCIHRDLKPDNILIDSKGHIKLSDFGLSKVMNRDIYCKDIVSLESKNLDTISGPRKNKRRAYAHSTVGTPDYIAPEIFKQKGYGPEVDWWSLGVILFEMIIGYPPFYANTPNETCQKILRWEKYLSFPKNRVSKEAIDLMASLITDVDKRLGYNGAEEIKRHSFFKKIDWSKVRKMPPPFVPKLDFPYDAKYFDKFEESEPFHYKSTQETNLRPSKKDVCFVDFTYKKEIEDKPALINAIEIMNSIKQNFKNINDEITREHEELKKKMGMVIISDKDSNKNTNEHGPLSSTRNPKMNKAKTPLNYNNYKVIKIHSEKQGASKEHTSGNVNFNSKNVIENTNSDTIGTNGSKKTSEDNQIKEAYNNLIPKNFISSNALGNYILNKISKNSNQNNNNFSNNTNIPITNKITYQENNQVTSENNTLSEKFKNKLCNFTPTAHNSNKILNLDKNYDKIVKNDPSSFISKNFIKSYQQVNSRQKSNETIDEDKESSALEKINQIKNNFTNFVNATKSLSNNSKTENSTNSEVPNTSSNSSYPNTVNLKNFVKASTLKTTGISSLNASNQNSSASPSHFSLKPGSIIGTPEMKNIKIKASLNSNKNLNSYKIPPSLTGLKSNNGYVIKKVQVPNLPKPPIIVSEENDRNLINTKFYEDLNKQTMNSIAKKFSSGLNSGQNLQSNSASNTPRVNNYKTSGIDSSNNLNNIIKKNYI